MHYNPENETHVAIGMSIQTAIEVVLEDKTVLIDFYLKSGDIPIEKKEAILSGDIEVRFVPVADLDVLAILIFNEYLESTKDEDVHYLCNNILKVLKLNNDLLEVHFVEADSFESLTLDKKVEKLGEVIALSVAFEKIDASLTEELIEMHDMTDRIEEQLLVVNADRDIDDFYTADEVEIGVVDIKYRSYPLVIAESYKGQLAQGLTIEQILTDEPMRQLIKDGHISYRFVFKFRKDKSSELSDEYDEYEDE